MKTLFLAWQDSISRAWFPVGRLTYDKNWYQFVYIKGAEIAKDRFGFRGIFFTEHDFYKIYRSRELFPVFSSRTMPRSRPDYPDFLRWQNLSQNEDNPMTLLSRSGGKKLTDNYEVFPYPEREENGFYHLYFFLRGLRYMPPENNDRITKLEVGESLYFLHDSQNDFDGNALMLRTKDFYLLGFCPRYLDVFLLLQNNPNLVEVKVERVNLPPAPLSMRVLCHLIIKDDNYRPFSSSMYEPLAVPVAVGN
jgi:hypothetical protein